MDRHRTTNTLTNLQELVLQDLVNTLRKVHVVDHGGIFPKDDVWLSVRDEGWNGMRPGDIMISTAPAPGGGWRVCGNGHVHPDHVELKLQTVLDIMKIRTASDRRLFDFGDPAFPENLYDFLRRVAVNAERANNLKHRRYWARHSREFRKKHLTD